MRGQAGFWDVDERYALLSEAGDPLVKLNEVVPWEVFRKPLAKALKRSDGAKGGRPPFDPVMMFKVLVLQALYDLSDDQAEFVVNDRLSFLGLGLGDKVPDAKTIWLFREHLVQARAINNLFARFDKHLSCLAHLAHHDSLTGLANRVLLQEWLDEELKRSRQGDGFALLCLDLDGFKGVNDTLGHAAGDELLKSVGERLNNCVRETDLVARLGGDEFAILQASVEQPSGATTLAERIYAAISAPFNLGHDEVTIGGSIGIALAPKDGSEPDQLLANADLALYHAKGNGRGTYHLFEPGLETSTKRRHALGSDLRGAHARNEFELYFQPLFNLKESKVSGFEALLRWHHGKHGTVSPNEFIPVAEETGLISEIGEWVLRQACAEAVRWPDSIKIAVNVSPIQFRRCNLVQMVRDTLAATGLCANRLELEITESVLMQDSIEMLAKLHELKEIGVRISMDDFGTGYSSLSYLRSFPFDRIKIDASFVRGLLKAAPTSGSFRLWSVWHRGWGWKPLRKVSNRQNSWRSSRLKAVPKHKATCSRHRGRSRTYLTYCQRG